MLQTLFTEYVEKYFRMIVGKITEKFNDKNKETELLHKTMLTEEYSADMTWESTNINHSIVAADVVSMDSSIPLKKRGVLERAGGKLPKLAIKYRKGEKDISDINVMIARGADEATVAAKIFDDAQKAVRGIDVRTEIMFEEALSTGACVVESDSNDGTGIRVTFGYKDENTFHAITAGWDEASATPVTDLQQLFDKAQSDGSTISHLYISRKRFNNIRNSTEGKELTARYLNVVYTSSANLPVPSRATLLDALYDEFGATFHVVDNAYRIQNPNGTYQTVKPFAEDNVVAVPAENVGRLVYGTLVEETNPVNQVTYQKSGSHILVSKYSTNDPFAEFTSAQAICLPVIDGVDSIYILHTDATTGGLSVDPDTLNFEAEGGAQTADIHYDGPMSDITVTSSETFCTVRRRNDKLTLTCSAYSGQSARTATVTVTAGTSSATISVSQGGSK